MEYHNSILGPDGRVFAQEDKDKAVLWAQDPVQYTLQAMHFLTSNPALWLPAQVEPRAYSAMILNAHVARLRPLCVPHLPSPRLFLERCIPTMYFNPKEKTLHRGK